MVETTVQVIIDSHPGIWGIEEFILRLRGTFHGEKIQAEAD